MKSVAFRSRVQALPVQTHVSRNMNTCAIRAQQSAPVLVKSDGTRYTIEKVAVLGSSSSADIVVQGDGVQPEHAKIEYRAGRLFCTALSATDPDNLLSPTATWVEGTELRPGVSYMCAPQSTLCFGTAGSNAFIAEFEEGGGGGAMADMLMKGMASQASKEVQDRLQNLG